MPTSKRKTVEEPPKMTDLDEKILDRVWDNLDQDLDGKPPTIPNPDSRKYNDQT